MTGLLVRWGLGRLGRVRTIDHVAERADKLFVQLVSWRGATRLAQGSRAPFVPAFTGHGYKGDEHLGELISLAARRAVRAAASAPLSRVRASFYFDLASPWTYLAAERVERRFAGVRWQPVVPDALPPEDSDEMARRAVEERAAELRLPLVWPEKWPTAGRRAMRVASLAAETRRAAPFVLAVSRLAFCGGYDVDDPEALAEAAAAAGLGLDECLRAASDVRRDAPLERAALRLVAQGADALPAFVVGRTVFCGEDRLAEAAALADGRRFAMGPPPLRRIEG
jgi:2-hydroxychromene-2-carboxylate isomerase